MTVLIGTRARRNAWIEWLDHCLASDGQWSNPLFFGKTIGGVPTPAVPAFAALESALRATGYSPTSRWAYNFRGISGATCTCASYGSCSLHGNGIAIDIDPAVNPYKATALFRWSDTKFTPTQIAAVEGIRNTKGEQVWEWGGRWGSVKDYMHFELRVRPQDMEIDWSTVAGWSGGGGEPGGDAVSLPITPQSSREDIRLLQLDLNHGIGTGLVPDGIYGAGTAAEVKRWLLPATQADEDDGQANSLLDQGFVVNAAMWRALRAEVILKTVPASGGTVDQAARQAAATASSEAARAHTRINGLKVGAPPFTIPK